MEVESNIKNNLPRIGKIPLIKPNSGEVMDVYQEWKEFLLIDIPNDIIDFWKWLSGRGDERDILFVSPIYNYEDNPVFEK